MDQIEDLNYAEELAKFKRFRQQVYWDHLPLSRGGSGMSYSQLAKKYNRTPNRIAKIVKTEEKVDKEYITR